MATFAYKGVNDSGEVITGVVEAFDEIEAMESARANVRIVQSVKLIQSKDKDSLLNMDINIGGAKINDKNLAVLCTQLAIILRAGIPAARAINMVARQTDDKRLKEILTATAKDLSSGRSMAESLSLHGPELPRVFIETVRAGEESGRLSERFERLAQYYEHHAKVAGKVGSALIYPIFVAIVAVVVVMVMMVMVIPTMTNIMMELGTELPITTKILIGTSEWFQKYWFVVLLVMAAIGLGYKGYNSTENGKRHLSETAMKMPIIGQIKTLSSAAQFANTMATLSEAGMGAVQCLKVTSRVLDSYALACECRNWIPNLEEGRTLGECLKTSQFLPPTLIEMVSMGEESGALEETLNNMGVFYDAEAERVTNNALAMMEPAMLVLLAAFAGFIVIALYLPMFTMYGAM